MLTPKRRKTKTEMFWTHRTYGTILSLIAVVSLCTRAILHLHIEGVLYTCWIRVRWWKKMYDGLRSKVKRMTEVEKVKGGQPHFWTLLLNPP